jgi:hypothetical protein
VIQDEIADELASPWQSLAALDRPPRHQMH